MDEKEKVEVVDSIPQETAQQIPVEPVEPERVKKSVKIWEDIYFLNIVCFFWKNANFSKISVSSA